MNLIYTQVRDLEIISKHLNAMWKDLDAAHDDDGGTWGDGMWLFSPDIEIVSDADEPLGKFKFGDFGYDFEGTSR